MNSNCPTAVLQDRQRLCLEMAADAVETGKVAPDQLLCMLTAEVGHTDSEVVYEENKLELRYYEPDERRYETPIFVVYALINRPYILDLQPDRSVVRRLLEAGFPVYLVDWGEPTRLDGDLALADYVCRYLDNCVEAVLSHAGSEDLHLLGYCMGGTMAAMYAARNQAPVRTLSWMAMPYAFDGDAGILERWAEYFDPDTAVDALGNVPGDLLAVEFSLMEPIEHYLGKYVRLYENIEDEEFVTNFARMERWIWDGVDVAGETFREFVDELYRENLLVAGEFELAGDPVDVSAIDAPVLGIVGEYDHIVPPESSRPFLEHVGSEDTRLLEFSAGHIGISVSTSAHERLWPEVTDWLAERSLPGGGEATVDADGRTDAEKRTDADERTDANGRGAAEAGDDPRADDREQARRAVESVAQRAAAQVAGGERSAAVTPPESSGSRPVESIVGVGSTYADRLTMAGIETVADLRGRDPGELAAITDAPRGLAEAWLDQVS